MEGREDLEIFKNFFISEEEEKLICTHAPALSNFTPLPRTQEMWEGVGGRSENIHDFV